MFKQFIAFLFVITFAYSASATKERGGGNVDETGTLAEAALAADSVVLNLQDLRVLLLPMIAKIGGEFPGLFEDLLFIDDESSHWYLNSKFNHQGCEFKSVVDVGAQTVACQEYDSVGITEIRISKNFWSTASDAQKADLILHERLRTLLYRNGVSDCETCLFRAVMALKAPSSDSYLLDVQQALRVNRVGTYFFQLERLQIAARAKAIVEKACSSNSPLDYQRSIHSELLTANDPSMKTRALRYVLWIHAANAAETCRDIDQASFSVLDYYRGEEVPL